MPLKAHSAHSALPMDFCRCNHGAQNTTKQNFTLSIQCTRIRRCAAQSSRRLSQDRWGLGLSGRTRFGKCRLDLPSV